MKMLKRLAAAIALTFMLAFAAFADCPPPGDVSTPPCSGVQLTSDDPVISAETSESSTSTLTVVEISETTVDVLLSALSIF